MEINVKNNSDLKEFQNRIGYHFNDEKYLKTALTHSSFANEVKMRKVNDNERLEFLGDAVLELTSSDYIYKQAFSFNKFGYGSAAAIILGIFMVLFTVIFNKTIGKEDN